MFPYLNHFNMLQIISFLLVFVKVTFTGSSLTHDEECSALFQFKQTMIHQDDAACATHGFQAFHSWKPTNNATHVGYDCCSWYGVECSNEYAYGHVIGLDLSETSLCGHINSNNTLFSLVNLQSLNLAMNDFSESQIPSEIANLKQLRSLNLSSSGFSGQIPIEISHLIQMSSLDLSMNRLNLQSPGGLKNLVQNLTRLEELHLSGVDISSSVPHLLANFSSLRSIQLRDCSLRNEFPSSIFQLPMLKILNVAYNTDLTGSFPEFRNKSLLEHVNLRLTGFFGIVPQSISNLNNLIFLRLTGCSFSGRIPGSLSNLTQLTALGLGTNKFTGFVPSLESLSKLNVLELNDNRFEKGRFPNWLGKLSKVTELYLYNMSINSEIPPILANLTELSVVAMGNNSLSGYIPSGVFNLTKLISLDLQQNQLQGPISSSFSNLKNLQYLALNSNRFIGRVELDMFLGLNKLETLVLSHISLVVTNNYNTTALPEFKILGLSMCDLKEFPSFLRFQNKMEILYLDKNKINGLVPMWIWNNNKETLRLINLSNNSITGFHKHPQFLPWRRLEGLFIDNNQVQGHLPIPPQTTIVYDISYNNLTGDIPTSLCELKSLRSLDLSFNNMSGTLPSCLGSFSSSLVKLNVRRNNFHGRMMQSFMHESLLENIDLSKNEFTGQLPRSMINCTNLEILSLGDNSFDDIFPSWLGTLPELQVLVLRSNKFYGPIQSSRNVSSLFPKLRIIDLSNNGFSGQLPQNYFQTWNGMKLKRLFFGKSSVMELNIPFSIGRANSRSLYSMTLTHKGVVTEYEKILTIFTAIDLSCNNFEGEIPISLQDLLGLQSLNLSNNNFRGRILPSLGNLKNLESLDLSRNNLVGKIPQQLVELGFLSIFNVSFNHLYGHIPQGKQFDTFDNNSYMGNPQLCGQPLSKECQSPKAASRLPPTRNVSESLFPSERIDWIIVFCGVGSGLVVGIVIENFLYTKYSDRFTKRKDRWVRPLRNKRRNHGVS